MKKLLLIILSIFLLVGIVYAKGAYYYGAETVTAGGSDCTTTVPSSSNTRLVPVGDSNLDIGDEDGYYYIGQVIETAGAHTICKVTWKLGAKVGTPTTSTLYSQIWTMTGTALNVMVNESADTYTNPDNYTALEFTHNYTINTGYAVVITMKDTDASNYFQLAYYQSDKDNEYSDYARWLSDKSQGSTNSDYDCRGQFYE